MPIPDLSGVPPWAGFDDHQNKLNDIVAKYNNLLVNLDSLNVVSLTADHIDAGTIDANIVTIRSDLTDGAYVQIDGNGMRINNGEYNTFSADINGLVTMTGAIIRNNLSEGYIELSDQGIAINNGIYNTFTANSEGFVTMTGALIQSAFGQFPLVTLSGDGLQGYGPDGTLKISLGQETDGGSLSFWDNENTAGTVFADLEGMHVGNKGALIISSTDDYTYFRGPLDFSGVYEVSGLEIGMVEDLERQLNEIRSNFFTNAVINGDFDENTRNLKLYSNARTVATINIPEGSGPVGPSA